MLPLSILRGLVTFRPSQQRNTTITMAEQRPQPKHSLVDGVVPSFVRSALLGCAGISVSTRLLLAACCLLLAATFLCFLVFFLFLSLSLSLSLCLSLSVSLCLSLTHTHTQVHAHTLSIVVSTPTFEQLQGGVLLVKLPARLHLFMLPSVVCTIVDVLLAEQPAHCLLFFSAAMNGPVIQSPSAAADD